MTDGRSVIPPRGSNVLQFAPPDTHSIRVGKTPTEIYQLGIIAMGELLHAITQNDRPAIIAAERRLVAVAGLAQISANELERNPA